MRKHAKLVAWVPCLSPRPDHERSALSLAINNKPFVMVGKVTRAVVVCHPVTLIRGFFKSGALTLRFAYVPAGRR